MIGTAQGIRLARPGPAQASTGHAPSGSFRTGDLKVAQPEQPAEGGGVGSLSSEVAIPDRP